MFFEAQLLTPGRALQGHVASFREIIAKGTMHFRHTHFAILRTPKNLNSHYVVLIRTAFFYGPSSYFMLGRRQAAVATRAQCRNQIPPLKDMAK